MVTKRTLRRFVLVAVILLIALTFVSCASTPATGKRGAPAQSDVFPGRGEGSTLGTAMNAAKRDAIRNGVITLVGEISEAANSEQLHQNLYSTRNPNQYVRNDQMEILYRDNLGSMQEPRYVMDIEIPVRLDAVQQTLDSLGITATEQGGDQVVQTGTQTQPGGGGEFLPGDADIAVYDGASSQQARFLQRYIENMTYMVFYPDESDTESLYLRQAVAQANSYLATEGYTLIDASQIERLRQDQEMVFETEAQREVGLVQWIAQRLNADVYLEVDADVTGETQDGSHYGSANILIRIYETSTGQLLGSVPFRSQRTFSRSSQQDAVSNAVQSAVFGAMPTAVRQSQNLLAQAYSSGIRYEMVLLNTSDPRVISQMRSRLRNEVSDLVTVSQTADETRYAVYYFGRLDELEDLMYDLSDRVTGMENLFLVMTRGKSITFDLGL